MGAGGVSAHWTPTPGKACSIRQNCLPLASAQRLVCGLEQEPSLSGAA